jgi:CpeT/CpcT family (DUF1001)
MKTHLFFLFALTLILGSCHSSKTTSTNDTSANSTGRRMDNFTYLKRCMDGNFSSIEQSQADKDYFDIRLRMVPIWEATPNQFYLYVEQAVASSLDKPYRQRVYRVEKIDDTHFVSHIYMAPHPEQLTGKLSGDAIFNSFTPDSLTLKDGCAVHLAFDAKALHFTGSTEDKKCPSDRQGASYATSVVTITDQQMVSWDQGWDVNGVQVWGAKKGGYIFKKQP